MHAKLGYLKTFYLLFNVCVATSSCRMFQDVMLRCYLDSKLTWAHIIIEGKPIDGYDNNILLK